ncbi:cytochrome C assembly family protein [Mammaliicoccus stepanovicii]|uniref:HemA concentration negative effector n=1 Tax=Mammaliicoccus stepanovicii TaxID=643214 RepID=A0A239Z3F7_9STAP|nr:cytochrome c biogenesis protein CcsA [Mammaliicoccus stepanovicii]PNZ78072.1 cytochrome C assembly protein [Mammaliicoccus stepanovicii]GGI40283.1 cytochrome c assembly protein [Mammaliicoccus stepanovicii]SNV65064.1 HemA concentration negative effector [Mammaliicoccus stepanovicii]
MQDLIAVRLHEIVLVIYMFCLGCYFYDFIQKNATVRRVGYYTLGIVWIFQTIFLLIYIIETKQFPVLTLFEGFYFYTWMIITVSLVLNYFKSTDLTVFIINLIGFVFLTIHTFRPEQFDTDNTASSVMNELLLIHVSLAILSYVIFALSTSYAILYLLQRKNLKEKKFNQKFFRMGSLEQLEQNIFKFSLVGFLVLLISLILGVQWGIIIIGSEIWFDPKVIGSLVVLLLYGIYLFVRVGNRINTKTLVLANIMIFLVCMINYLIVSKFSGFHQWLN